MQDKILALFLEMFHSEVGATAMEYGLMAALIAAVIIGAVLNFGLVTSNAFNGIASSFRAAS